VKFARLGGSLAALTLTLSTVACSDGATPTAQQSAQFTAIIDVRTPEEFAAGHVPNSLNFDVTAAAFDAQLSTLDTAGSYLIYCRSGNRSAQAAERMKAVGLSVTDGGGLSDMENAGWEFVR
jgi:phage shock protein E